MAAVVAPNFTYTNSASSQMPKMSSSRRGMDGGLSKRVVLFCNGDKFFKGKKVYIVPTRYHNFSDFLNDLTGKLPSLSSLPYGVRQIFSPTSGRKIRDVEELSDGRGYVCAGFEQFRPLNYGEFINNEPQRVTRVQAAPRPSATVRHRGHQQPRGSHDEDAAKVAHVVKEPVALSMSRDIKSPRDAKSKLFVVISNAIRPRKIIRIFLSPHTFPTMDRLMNELQHQFALVLTSENGGDSSLASAAVEYASGKIRRLYSIHGVEISSPADFFKVDDHYIALGSEKFTTADLKEIMNEIFPNGSWPKNIFKSWESQRSRKRKPSSEAPVNAAVAPPQAVLTNSNNNQKPQPAAGEPGSKRTAATKDADASESVTETTSKMPKTGKSGAETTVAQAPPPPVAATVAAVPPADSRSRIEGERMKKDSGFVEEILTKESNSPNHHIHHPGSIILTSVEQQPPLEPPQQQQQRTPRVPPPPPAVEPAAELATVFEAKSVETAHDSSQQLPPLSISLASEKPQAQQQLQQSQDKSLKPVQPPIVRSKPAAVQQPQEQQVPSHAAPGNVVASNAPKKTRDVDPELANLLDRQQMPTSNVQKYAVLPEIGHTQNAAKTAANEEQVTTNDINNQADDEKSEANKREPVNQTERLPAEKPVLEQAAPKDNSAAPAVESLPPAPIPSTVSAPSRQTPGQQAAQPAQITPASDSSPAATTSEAQQKTKTSQQGHNRPKLEHAALIIDGRPESRTASRSSSAAPSSAPGRVIVGKLSRQLSRIEHVTARFEYVGKQLGDGNFAVVRRCRRKKTGMEFAMKIIDKAKLKGKFHMVENEIRIMRACDHQNLVKLYEMYETDKEIFLVMELVPDGDLFDAITAAVKFDEATASKMVHDMASGLFYLHSRRIVHRDLKPENLLVLRSPQSSNLTLKLGDFGLAMEVTEPIYSVCGTPTYVAPEILSEKGYGLEVDLWALGVISYILLCGFPPFRSQKRRQSELFEQIKSGKFVFLSPYWDAVSVLAKELISKLLVVDARRRYSAPDVLCHPWVISQGSSSPPPGDMVVFRKNLRKTLDDQSRANWKQWVSVRQKNGFNAVLAGNGPINRPSSRT